MKRKTFLLSLLLGAGLASAQMKNPDTLSVVTLGDWGSGFDPAYCYDTACGNVLTNTLEGLYGYEGNDATKVVPLLAASLPKVSNGGKTYTVTLKKGLKFSDGTPVTAEDVAYSLQRVMVYSTDVGAAPLLNEPLLGSAAQVTKDDKGAWAKISGSVQAKGTDTVVFNLAKPFSPFPAVLAFPSFGVVSKAAAVKAGGWSGDEKDWKNFNNLAAASSKFVNSGMVGTAPFVIERYDPGKSVVLKRNANYWRAPAKLSRVIIQSAPDDTTRLQLLRTGDADMAERNAVPNALLAQAAQLPNAVVKKTPSLGLYGFFMTEKLDPSGTDYLGSGKLDGKGIPANFFSDVNVRKGFAYSFDYAGFLKDVMQGNASQQNTVNISGLLGESANDPRYKLDKNVAAAAFKKAFNGDVWKNGFTVVGFYNSGNSTRQRGLDILAKNLASVNPKFNLQVRELPFSQYLAQSAAHKIPVWMGGWGADYADPHNFAQPFLASEGNYPVNMVYKNATLDKLIAQAVEETNTAKRAALYQQIAEIGFQDAPVIAVYQPKDSFVTHTWVKGQVFNPIYSSDYYYPMFKQQ